MKFEGKIVVHRDTYHEVDYLMVDAEPHVMQRIRKIFDNSSSLWERGQYTHKPIYFSNTLTACRDLVWLMERYRLSCEPDLLKRIQDKANQYDKILQDVSDADKDTEYRVTPNALRLGVTLRAHQISFNNMAKKMKHMLLADTLGLGKTFSLLSVLSEPEARPAIIIVPANLCTQWEREIKVCLPDIITHVIRGFKTYELPQVDVIITAYGRLAPWQDRLNKKDRPFKTVIMDEIHELRHTGTAKRLYTQLLTEKADYSFGASGTPIFNYGNEIWSVLDVIKKGCLGTYEAFSSEWCTWDKVFEPATLNSFLKNQGLMLRRTPEEVGLDFGKPPSKHIYTIDSDLEKLKEVEDVAKLLAMSVLSGNVGEDSESSREFDWKLRHATGVAKARPVAEFVKMLVEQGEKVVLGLWHREVYSIIQDEFKKSGIKSVMYSGTESVKEKDQAVKDFIEGDAKVFMISLRSGAGLDGLQKVCNTVVFGELDWTGQPMDQIVGRVFRDGQTRHVNAYYLTIADGADPFMIETLGVKRSQHEGVVEGKQAEGDIILQTGAGKDRVKEMAAAYLKSIGEEVPEAVPETGLLGELTKIVRTMKLPTTSEEDMQVAMARLLDVHLPKDIKIEREFKITKRSRLDFLATRGDERVAIELKIESTGRPEVYRQVRRYVEEGQINGLLLVAPWNGIGGFRVDGTPVLVVDTNLNAI